MYVVTPLGAKFMETIAKDTVDGSFCASQLGKACFYPLRKWHVQDLCRAVSQASRRVLGVRQSSGSSVSPLSRSEILLHGGARHPAGEHDETGEGGRYQRGGQDDQLAGHGAEGDDAGVEVPECRLKERSLNERRKRKKCETKTIAITG